MQNKLIALKFFNLNYMKDIQEKKEIIYEASEEGQAFREFDGALGIIIKVIAIIIPLYCIQFVFNISGLYFSTVFYPLAFQAIFFAAVLVLTFLLVPASRNASKDKLPWYDILLCVISIVPSVYVFLNYETYFVYQERVWGTPFEQVLFVIEILVIFEAVRRTVGFPVLILGIIFLLHAKFAYLLPGLLGAPAMNLSQLTAYIYLHDSGVFGFVVGLAATIIIVFVLFGHFLNTAGAGKFFIDLALSLAGRFRGGPAKVALLGSALFGTVSGSASANVGVTGAVTIPLMKKMGYKSHFAAAVETIASTGGTITPPIMGAVAFIIAEYTGVSYGQVALAAVLPAILYFICLYFQLDFEAAKLQLSGLPRSELPSFKRTIIQYWPFLIPLLMIIVFLMILNWDPMETVLYGIIVVLVVSWFRKETRMGIRKILNSLAAASKSLINIVPVCGLAGIIMGSVSLTGLGVNISAVITEAAGNNLLLLTVLSLIVIYLSGMAISILVVYIVMAIIVTPAMVDLGVPVLAAHMFIFYAGASMFFTPPFCPAVFVASSMAGSNMWRTAFQSMKLGIVCYLIPIIIIFKPALILIGNAGDIAIAVLTAIVASFLIAIGVEGYFLDKVPWHQRILFAIGGLLLFTPDWTTDVIGIVLVIVPIILQLKQYKNRSSLIHGKPKPKPTKDINA